MPDIAPGTPLHSFIDAIRRAFADVLSQSLAVKWNVELSHDGAQDLSQETIPTFGIKMSGGVQGDGAIRLKGPDAGALAQRFLSESGELPTDLTPEHKEAVEELLRQVTGLAATNLKPQFGEVRLEVTVADSSPWPGVSVGLVASSETLNFPLEIRLNPELLASISSAATLAPASSTEATSGAGDATSQVPQVAPIPPELNLDLLLGVNLNLTLRFGQQTLTLREILNLNSGAVIELDRKIHEPADLLLGERVIARGEVVIVDNNYGLRITDVIDPHQRIDRLP